MLVNTTNNIIAILQIITILSIIGIAISMFGFYVSSASVVLIIVCFNSFIHTIMYTYYTLAAFGKIIIITIISTIPITIIITIISTIPIIITITFFITIIIIITITIIIITITIIIITITIIIIIIRISFSIKKLSHHGPNYSIYNRNDHHDSNTLLSILFIIKSKLRTVYDPDLYCDIDSSFCLVL